VRALAALALCGCAGTTGTVAVELVTAPDSHVLDAVQRIRMTLTQPHQVVEGTRGPAGFDLALELDATNTGGGALIVEGFDAAGARIACGQTPPFSLAALNAKVKVYVAAPSSIAIAPAALGAARSGVAGAPISYGAVLAGGLDGTTAAPASSIAVYNAYDHSLSEGVALPAARSGLAIAAGAGSTVYLFGGTGSDGKPTGTLWQFDTGAPPMGSFTPVTEQPGFARSGELLVAIDAAHYLITGMPALELVVGTTTSLTARSEVAGLPAAGAAVTGATPTAVFAGMALVRFRGEQFDTLTGDGRSGAAVTTLPDGRIAVLGGTPATPDALVIDPATGGVGAAAGALSTPRIGPAIATTSRHVVVAGGSDATGAPIATADVLDARTLARLATLPILARTGGFAIALPNDQVLLGGGAPAAAALELFTPEPP
jgi:galactose oxidase-like protein